MVMNGLLYSAREIQPQSWLEALFNLSCHIHILRALGQVSKRASEEEEVEVRNKCGSVL